MMAKEMTENQETKLAILMMAIEKADLEEKKNEQDQPNNEIKPQQTPKPTKEQIKRAMYKIMIYQRAEKLKAEAQTQDNEETNNLNNKNMIPTIDKEANIEIYTAEMKRLCELRTQLINSFAYKNESFQYFISDAISNHLLEVAKTDEFSKLDFQVLMHNTDNLKQLLETISKIDFLDDTVTNEELSIYNKNLIRNQKITDLN